MAFVRCGECRYFIEKENYPDYGECRKLAPRPTVGTTDHRIDPETHATIWPYVRRVDGCFEGEMSVTDEPPEVVDPNDTPSRAMAALPSEFLKTNPLTGLIREQADTSNEFDDIVKGKNGKPLEDD